jgi:hypothetical protein
MWVFQKELYSFESYINLFRGMHSVLNCHDVAKHTELYLGYLRFNVTSNGNAGCFKKSFTMVFPYVAV